MKDETKQALDERINWTNQVTDLARKPDIRAVVRAIEEVGDEHLRSLILVLVLTRVDDYERVKDHYRQWIKEREAEWPMQSDN